jgi:hypothetical protein
MIYEHWWDRRHGDQYAVRIEHGKVTGWSKLPPSAPVTAASLPGFSYDTDAGNIAYCEEIRPHAEVLLSVEGS